MSIQTYAPYEIVDDLSGLGFQTSIVQTDLGSIRIASSATPIVEATVFLHGVGLSLEMWTPLIQSAQALGQPTDSWILIDLPGFGESSPLPRGTSIEQVGEAISQVLGSLNLTSYLLVGHSMGGFIALDMASRSPSTLLAVLSISGAYGGVVDTVNCPFGSLVKRPSTWFMYQLLRGANNGHAAARFLPQKMGLFNPVRLALRPVAAHPWLLPESFMALLISRIRGDSFRIASRTGLAYDYSAKWSGIQVPTVSTFGTRDALVTEADATALAAINPNVTTVRIADSGHFAPIEQPRVVVNLIHHLQEMLAQ